MSRQTLATYTMMEKVGYQMLSDALGMKDKSVVTNVALFKVQSHAVLTRTLGAMKICLNA